MNKPTLPEPPQVGETLPIDYFSAIEFSQNLFQIFGFDLTRNATIFSLAAVLFYFGVTLSCFTNLNKQAPFWKVYFASVPVFFLSSPFWFLMLENRWTNGSMPLLDAAIQWARGSGSMPSNLFSLGLVIVLGLFSWNLFQSIVKLVPFVTKDFTRRAKAFLRPTVHHTGKVTSQDNSKNSNEALKCPDCH